MGAGEQGAAHTEGRWQVTMRTLSFVLNGGDVLLMKRGAHKRIFPNRYNGVGGHVERGEDVLTSARREITEETGLHVHHLRLCAVYNIDAGEQTGIALFVFVAESDVRDVTANEEGTLHWVAPERIAALDVVDDVRDVLPRVLAMRVGDPTLYYHVGYDAADRMVLRLAAL